MSDQDHLRHHPYSVYMEAMQAYTDRHIVEEFNKHGWPEGYERICVARTLRSVLSGEFRDKYRYDPEHQVIQRRTKEGWETIYPPEAKGDTPEAS
jgi:hypothetical protein